MTTTISEFIEYLKGLPADTEISVICMKQESHYARPVERRLNIDSINHQKRKAKNNGHTQHNI